MIAATPNLTVQLGFDILEFLLYSVYPKYME